MNFQSNGRAIGRSSPNYSTGATRRLKLGRVIQLGPNHWYVVPGRASDGVLKVRHGIIQEVGIANRQLTDARAAAVRLLIGF